MRTIAILPDKTCYIRGEFDVEMNMDTNIEKEKTVLRQMIRLYCRLKEGNKELCPQCTELMEYAMKALDRCRFGEDKPSCRKCPIHCYRPDMRERIRTLMRWAGPRMIFFHPISAIRHLIRERGLAH